MPVLTAGPRIDSLVHSCIHVVHGCFLCHCTPLSVARLHARPYTGSNLAGQWQVLFAVSTDVGLLNAFNLVN